MMALSKITSLLTSTKSLLKGSTIILQLLFTASFSLMVFSRAASSDAISNPYRQIDRQRQLEQETKMKGLIWKNEIRQELEAEIKTENAIQDYYNRLN